VGAPKSGTTALWRFLAQHPSIFMSPIKEANFFAPEVAAATRAAGRILAVDDVDRMAICWRSSTSTRRSR